jgi:multidrug efflux pump subunit AcrA (membrane-fusion protein)
LREVSVGAPARISVPALAGLALDVTVSAIAPLVESATRTAEVRMEVPNESGRLSPGMFVGVEIESSARHAGLALPDAAVMEVEGRTCVFVPLEPGSSTFCLHAVTVGPPVREWIPVKSGLKEGDLVVVSGAFLLKAELGKSSATHEH